MPSWRLNHPSTLTSIYALNGNARDGTGRYPGTLVNAPTWAAGPRGRQCIELNGGNQYVNVGDVAELNSVSAFTICFWMNQDVLDQQDIIFRKFDDATHDVTIWLTGGDMQMRIRDGADTYGGFDYSTVISALNWHHVAWVFDGAQTGNANRLVCYVDGNPVTLAFNLTIPAVTADIAADGTIGLSSSSFDGKLYDFRIYSVPLSRDEVIQIMHAPVPHLAG